MVIHYLHTVHSMPQKIKHDYYRGENCMKTFSKDLKEHAPEIMNYGKKEMIPLTNK